MKEKLDIFELMAEAEQAENTVLNLPPDVRILFSGYQKSIMSLLTFSNVVAVADWAAHHPDQWEILKLHYIHPDLSNSDIAHLVGKTNSVVNYTIKQKSFISINDYWRKPNEK